MSQRRRITVAYSGTAGGAEAVSAFLSRACQMPKGYLSGIIRYAVEYFIRYQKCANIARVHPESLAGKTERRVFGFYSASDTVNTWLDNVKKERNIGPSKAVYIILSNSITEAEENEEEFFLSVPNIGEPGIDLLLGISAACEREERREPVQAEPVRRTGNKEMSLNARILQGLCNRK